MKSKRSKACDISKNVKAIVWERDSHRCIMPGCNNQDAMPNSHYVKRSQGGLGIPENIVTMCQKCHYEFDFTPKRQEMIKFVGMYLNTLYPNFEHQDRYYRKNR